MNTQTQLNEFFHTLVNDKFEFDGPNQDRFEALVRSAEDDLLSAANREDVHHSLILFLSAAMTFGSDITVDILSDCLKEAMVK